MRTVLSIFVLFYVTIVWAKTGNPAMAAQHGYGWTWEHSLEQWSDITAKTHEPHALLTYGPCNFRSSGPPYRYWEDWCWVTIQVPS